MSVIGYADGSANDGVQLARKEDMCTRWVFPKDTVNAGGHMDVACVGYTANAILTRYNSSGTVVGGPYTVC